MAYNTIKLTKHSDVVEEIKSTAVAITPGMLLELDSTAGYVKAHATEGGNVLPMFALEDELQGKGIADAYAVSVKVQVWIPGRGDIVYAIVEDGTSISIGDFLESNGSGFLQKHVPDIAEGGSSGESVTDMNIYTNQIIAQAIEAVAAGAASSLNSSESPIGLARRIKVRVI